MYYIYSVIMFLAFAALAFALDYFGVDGGEGIFYAVGWILIIISAITAGPCTR